MLITILRLSAPMSSSRRRFYNLFGQMLEALSDDGPDVVVRQEIDHGFSFSSALHQSGLLEDLELVGYRGLGHA